eukprot:613692-Prymnesium_polylepis.1
MHWRLADSRVRWGVPRRRVRQSRILLAEPARAIGAAHVGADGGGRKAARGAAPHEPNPPLVRRRLRRDGRGGGVVDRARVALRVA